MTVLDERPVLDQGCEEEIREGARRVAEAALGQYGAEVPAIFRQIAAKAAEEGRDESCDSFLMFAEEAEALLALGRRGPRGLNLLGA